MFGAIEDPYFRERGADVEDVGQRVIARLLGVRHHDLPLSEGAIVVASNLLPAHFATLEVEKVAAFVTEHGGPTSHGAIFARALEIPAVTGVAGIVEAARAGENAIVDGDSGTIFLSPDANAGGGVPARAAPRAGRGRAPRRAGVASGRDARRAPREPHRERRPALRPAPVRAARRRGHRAVPHRAARARAPRLPERGGAGAALRARWRAAMAPRPVTIRTLDLGGDKAIPGSQEQEENPQLGWRSIRLSLLAPRHRSARSCARSCARARTATCACCCRWSRRSTSCGACASCSTRPSASSTARDEAFDPKMPRRRDDRGAVGGGDRRRARARVRLLQHRHQRPHAVHAGGGSRQRARRASLRPAAPGGARADRPQRARGAPRRHPRLAVRRDGEQSARGADPRRARARRALRRRELGAGGEGDRPRARSRRGGGGRARGAASRDGEGGARDRRGAPAPQRAARSTPTSASGSAARWATRGPRPRARRGDAARFRAAYAAIRARRWRPPAARGAACRRRCARARTGAAGAVRSQLPKRRLGAAAIPIGTSGAPVALASATAPGLAMPAGPRGPSSRMAIGSPARTRRISARSRPVAPRELEPRALFAKPRRTSTASIQSPSRDRLTATAIRRSRQQYAAASRPPCQIVSTSGVSPAARASGSSPLRSTRQVAPIARRNQAPSRPTSQRSRRPASSRDGSGPRLHRRPLSPRSRSADAGHGRRGAREAPAVRAFAQEGDADPGREQHAASGAPRRRSWPARAGTPRG